MLSFFTVHKSVVRALFIAIFSSIMFSGCASVYVDTATKDIPVTDFKQPEKKKPVQLVFEFQTKGVPSAQATTYLQEQISKQVKNSGLFSNVEAASVAGVSMLNIKLNNIPLTENAAEQGFVTGLTFGVAGSAITDGYVCTMTYLPAEPQTKPLVKTAKHAIHTTLGNAKAPENAIKSASVDEAVRAMAQQIVSNALKDLSLDPQFN